MANDPTGKARPAQRAESVNPRRSALLGAMFLMTTSAIGPGFITQTTEFTIQLGATFAFVILLSILIDIAVQLNGWRVIGVSGMRAQELGNRMLPGVGYVMAALRRTRVQHRQHRGNLARPVMTLIGGTVGGYITYAGAHRLVDAGISGPNQVATVSRSAIYALLLTGLMRLVLFLAVFGVVAGGVALIRENPTAEAFQHAAGEIGLRPFGLILWSAPRVLLWGAGMRRDLLGGYRYPRWLLVIGLVAWLLTLYLGVSSLGGIAESWK